MKKTTSARRGQGHPSAEKYAHVQNIGKKPTADRTTAIKRAEDKKKADKKAREDKREAAKREAAKKEKARLKSQDAYFGRIANKIVSTRKPAKKKTGK